MVRDGCRHGPPHPARSPTRSVLAPAAAGSFDQSSMRAGTVENAANVLERVGLLGFLVGAPAEHARESHRDTGPVPRRRGDAFKAKLEDVHRFDMSDGTEPFSCMPADPLVHLCNLFVRQTGIRFRERD